MTAKGLEYAALMAGDPYLENWKAWAQEFTDRLLDSGISQETIKGIELFDAGECVAMPLKSANGIIPSGSMEAEGLALCRWLIEHNANEHSSRFRENEKRLDALLLTLNQIETSGEVAKGIKHSNNQSKNASHKRAIKNESGETLQDVINTLSKSNPGEKPNGLWPHLKYSIENWGAECEEIKPDPRKRDSWLYDYTIGDKRDTISYGAFRKKLPQ
jgi:hypothetical protein